MNDPALARRSNEVLMWMCTEYKLGETETRRVPITDRPTNSERCQ